VYPCAFHHEWLLPREQKKIAVCYESMTLAKFIHETLCLCNNGGITTMPKGGDIISQLLFGGYSLTGSDLICTKLSCTRL
jgi:hypothetical protein